MQLVWFPGQHLHLYTHDDMMSPILTLCFLLVWKDSTHLTKQPCTPRSISVHNTIVWSAWSKVFLKSNSNTLTKVWSVSVVADWKSLLNSVTSNKWNFKYCYYWWHHHIVEHLHNIMTLQINNFNSFFNSYNNLRGLSSRDNIL